MGYLNGCASAGRYAGFWSGFGETGGYGYGYRAGERRPDGGEMEYKYTKFILI